MTFKYEKKSTLGLGAYIQVKRAAKRPSDQKICYVTIGRIHENPSGKFTYYTPKTNQLNPTLAADDLNALKKKIEAHHK